MNKKIVIVGAGHAGVAAAFRLRALGFEGPVTLIGDEAELPYHRPPLSKTALSEVESLEPQLLRQEALYEREHIELLRDCRVDAIDRVAHKLVLGSGQTLDYDILVLATGSRARKLALAKQAENAYTLRTLSDARRIQAAIRGSRELLVVGGGYIGLEVAAAARLMGVHVTLVEQGSRILGRVASAETAAYFKALHEAQGVALKEGVGVTRFVQGAGRITHATLTDGTELAVDNVIAGIGVLPNAELAAASGLKVANGIEVDQNCRSSDPSVYAIGDCASFAYQGARIRLESIQNATDMANVAARAIVDQPIPYEPVPWFWSDQYSTKLQMVGLCAGDQQTIVRKQTASAQSYWHFDHQERLVAVEAINDPQAFMMAKRWLTTGYQPSLTHMADISVALKDVPPAEHIVPIAG